jgi:hypothetical protein
MRVMQNSTCVMWAFLAFNVQSSINGGYTGRVDTQSTMARPRANCCSSLSVSSGVPLAGESNCAKVGVTDCRSDREYLSIGLHPSPS